MSPPELPPRVVAGLSFTGRSTGQVKRLNGFRKAHHTVPDAANDITHAFLGKICAGELAAESEQLFQQVRAALAYKRKELTLEIAGATALLAARDFSLEYGYALDAADPASYVVTTTLRSLKSEDLARTPEFDALFAGRFSELALHLRKATRVEDVIDLIESLEGADGLVVTYPSDCRDCTIRVEGIAAVVRCTGSTLDMVFPQPGSPAALLDGFLAVRQAFAISKPLAGMLG